MNKLQKFRIWWNKPIMTVNNQVLLAIVWTMIGIMIGSFVTNIIHLSYM